jgi:hypothetical protein
MSAVEVYELVLDGTLPMFPVRFWEKPESLQSAKEIIQYIYTDLLKWDRQKAINNCGQKFFKTYRLGGMLTILFGNSPYGAIKLVYPDCEPWKLKQVPHGYWKDETVCNALEMIAKSVNKHPTKLIQTDFKGFGGLRDHITNNHGLFYYVDKMYLGKYKRWQVFGSVGNDYWTKENRISAVKWLVEDVLKIDTSKDDFFYTIGFNDFVSSGLQGLVSSCKDIYFNALKEAYPEKALKLNPDKKYLIHADNVKKRR